MAHNILKQVSVAALDVNAWVAKAVYASDIDDGNLVVLSTSFSSTAEESEVWTALVPSTANGLTGLWMVAEPEVVTTDGKYKGLDPDPRNFYIAAGKVFTVIKPQLFDLVELTADGLAGTKSTNTFVNATDTTGGVKPVWGATQTSNVFSMKLIGTRYVSIGTGAIDSQRVTSYLFRVVGL